MDTYTAHFLFYGALNDFLPHRLKAAPIPCTFSPHQTIKHLIEALGVPHLEVRQVLVNGQSVSTSLRLQNGCQVAVYPFEQESLSAGEARFILDNHLGKLAASLRMLGFDTLYRNDYQDDELAATAAAEQRILLTRDRRLLMRKVILRGYCVRPDDPQQQTRAVLYRYNLYRQVRPFQRCLRCNHPLQPVAKAEVFERLEPLTKLYFDEFSICPSCNQLYWKGSHYASMQTQIAGLVEDSTVLK
jgi:uncharacterized protein with PIN domain